MTDAPHIERVRHEPRRRTLTVARVERLAAQMVRVVLKGDDLCDFTSLGFDDHVKLFFPPSTQTGNGEARRDYTPRHFDATAGELWIDFFLHDAGPATAWAAQAEVGQVLEVGGPRGSAVISPEGIDAHVFIGDETALPAIGRRLEELPANTRALVVFEIDAGSVWPSLSSPAELEVILVERRANAGAPAQEVIERLSTLTFPPGQPFIWVALESQAARTIRRHLREERGIDKSWIKAAAYWKRGEAGAHGRIGDDD